MVKAHQTYPVLEVYLLKILEARGVKAGQGILAKAKARQHYPVLEVLEVLKARGAEAGG